VLQEGTRSLPRHKQVTIVQDARIEVMSDACLEYATSSADTQTKQLTYVSSMGSTVALNPVAA